MRRSSRRFLPGPAWGTTVQQNCRFPPNTDPMKAGKVSPMKGTQTSPASPALTLWQSVKQADLPRARSAWRATAVAVRGHVRFRGRSSADHG